MIIHKPERWVANGGVDRKPVEGNRPHEERLRIGAAPRAVSCPEFGWGEIPGIGSLGHMLSRTRVLFRLLMLQPIVYGNAGIWKTEMSKGRKNSLWSIL